MKYYKEIRYCRLCKKKFFVKSGKSRKYYCEKCQEKFTRDFKKRREDAEKDRKSSKKATKK